ncbi:MAG TPA: molybdopterin-dependent oxidoreductase, partial [Gemmataceae bacterium]|jgi:NADH-quinone oxidoreductase subunit G|nr:molybdopterin-dependent oxidoreductase [Gemmataceae bacterium]
MAVVYVNDKPVDIGNEKLNLIQAALKGGVFIPHYCWHPALTVVASCRMCLVEVGERKPDGAIAMQPKVVPACQTPAKDGTVVVTNSAKTRSVQGQILEGLLLNHPLDCPVCDKAGECLLQDFSYHFGNSQSRMIEEKNTPPNKPYISDTITLFADRCIMCSRCVRFTREISGQAELQVINRGNHSEIDIFPGEPLNNKLAGNVVDLCPVGALCSKDFLYKQRVWFLKPQKSVCADCSTGCSIFVDHNKDIVYRLRARENPQAQGYFMCDEGRYGFRYVNSSQRILQPTAGGEASSNGQPSLQVYGDMIVAVRRQLLDAASRDGAGVAVVMSPFLTCEEAYLLAKFMKGLSPQALLALGPVPVVGEDDGYPKDRHGRPAQPVKFTIHAEKCPNRKGVEAVLRHFQGDVLGFDQVVQRAAEGRLQALYMALGYPPRPVELFTPAHAESLRHVPLLIVQDLFPSPVSAIAQYVLPAASFAEKDGTFVNHKGLAQAVHWAIRPPRNIRTDGQVFLDLLERRGLFHAPSLRVELAREVPYFAPLATGDLGEHGVLLEGG